MAHNEVSAAMTAQFNDSVPTFKAILTETEVIEGPRGRVELK